MILKLILSLYVGYNIRKMVTYNGDEKSNDIGLLNLVEPVDIHETHTLIFQIFTKQIDPYIIDFEEMQDYLDISYKSIHYDFDAHLHEGEVT